MESVQSATSCCPSLARRYNAAVIWTGKHTTRHVEKLSLNTQQGMLRTIMSLFKVLAGSPFLACAIAAASVHWAVSRIWAWLSPQTASTPPAMRAGATGAEEPLLDHPMAAARSSSSGAHFGGAERSPYAAAAASFGAESVAAAAASADRNAAISATVVELRQTFAISNDDVLLLYEFIQCSVAARSGTLELTPAVSQFLEERLNPTIKGREQEVNEIMERHLGPYERSRQQGARTEDAGLVVASEMEALAAGSANTELVGEKPASSSDERLGFASAAADGPAAWVPDAERSVEEVHHAAAGFSRRGRRRRRWGPASGNPTASSTDKHGAEGPVPSVRTRVPTPP